MERWEIAIIGAGAAGLMASQAAAKAQRAQGRPVSVVVLEGNPKPGKKLLATGNGRCNLTNLDAGPAHYHGDVALAAPLLEACPPSRVLEEFQAMGLLCRADGEGRVYPRNLQAAAVLQILRQACQELGVTLACDWGVASLAREAGGFRLESAQGERLWCARCVLACGGKASPKHSWEGGGYALAQALGHRVTELRPALTALKSLKKCLRSLKGMRVRAKASLLAVGKPLYQESGEVLFGEGSLSGICVFNLSAHLPEHVTGAEVSLDLLEDLPYRDALAYVESQAKAHPSRQAWELFAGALNLRVGEELLKELSVPKEACFRDLSRQQLRKAASLAKDWRFPVTGTGGWEGAQVTAGGVPLGEVDTATLESKKCPGLYLAGELLHLHGDCGGYNLHWAWATGLAAGQSAGKKGEGDMLKITGLKLPLGFREGDLKRAAAKQLRLPESAIGQVRLCKKSVDARKKDNVHFVCAVEAAIQGDENRLLSRRRDNAVQKAEPYRYQPPQAGKLPQRPVVVGFGPAGMFAALLLAQCGQEPIVLERGQAVEERERAVQRFWKERVLDSQSNVQFGEGGAGTFSDGKLTTGTGDGRIRKVLEELVAAGAPEEILYEAKPHIGTDKLPGVVRSIRQQVIALGGEVRFSTQVTGFRLKEGRLVGLTLRTPAGEEVLECSQVILAIGHSARDTFQELHRLGLPMEAKAFSVGARIEHPASLIDRAQYGDFAGHPALGAADYKLSCHLENGRGVYTFCMCPGGTVTGAASEEGGVVTNGMSAWARDGRNSNAALLVGVTPADFGAEGPLAGVAFQREIERAAFRLAGVDYSAPAQRVADLLAGVPSKGFGGVLPTYEPGVVPGDIAQCLPSFVVDSMKAALPILGRRLRGFDSGDALLTAPETRSSSPVRILRDENCQSPLAQGLYPCGEGAGYAGGIVSAAVDGLRCAEAVLQGN